MAAHAITAARPIDTLGRLKDGGALAQSPFRYLDQRGGLALVLSWVCEDDATFLALTCVPMRDALHARFPRRAPGQSYSAKRFVCSVAGAVASVARFEWLLQHGCCPWLHLPDFPAQPSCVNITRLEGICDPEYPDSCLPVLDRAAQTIVCKRIAAAGRLDVLQRARAMGFAWSSQTCTAAAGAGHLALLQWCADSLPRAPHTRKSATCSNHWRYCTIWFHGRARANGCEWHTGCCAAAALTGQLQVLQWLHANGCEMYLSTATAAAEGGHLAVLRWAR
jgi:hypothetical protein